MKKTFLSLCLCSLTILLCGCKKEFPILEDNQANHGKLAIMATEGGYYYDYGYVADTYFESDKYSMKHVNHLLRYYDSESGETILVCNKPECEHNGSDTCTATYKDITIINSLLYNEEIYIYGVEEEGTIIRFNLYRTSLDGSSIDKIGTVFESENTIGQGYRIAPARGDSCFIIHNGYAYLPYYLRVGVASRGFMGGGLAKMDLQTGSVDLLLELEYMTSPFPTNLRGCGDYVYMDMHGTVSYNGTQRYIISRDELEYPPATADDKTHLYFDVVTTEQLFNLLPTGHPTGKIKENEYSMYAYDVASGEILPDKFFPTDITQEEQGDYFNSSFSAFPYKDMIVAITANRVVFYGCVKENWGQKLGEITYTLPEQSASTYASPAQSFKLQDDILYHIYFAPNPDNIFGIFPDSTVVNESSFTTASYVPYKVAMCPLEDILNGTGEWEDVFSFTTENPANIK